MTEANINVLIALSFIAFCVMCGCIRSAVIGYKHGWPLRDGETRTYSIGDVEKK